VTDNSANSSDSPRDPQEATREGFRELIEHLRQVVEPLDTRRVAEHDVKLLSRAIRELRQAFTVFEPYRQQRKVTIFGSARTPRDAPEYLQAEALGRKIVEHGWFVVTGAATGIMEAGHRGAGRDHSMGLNIMLPFEQESNEIIRGDAKLVTMKYFFTRKLMFVKECDAVVCLPGGFGTLDEAMEVLTLLQTGKRELMPVVLLDEPGGSYWRDWDAFVRKNLLDRGMISAEDLALSITTDDVDVAVSEITGFYRVFQSMEYLQDRLVFHLKKSPSAKQIAAIQQEFGDILTDGPIELRTPVRGAKSSENEAEAQLAFHFNRRNHGRLRRLIDWINAEVR
jgi:hypothetical protein